MKLGRVTVKYHDQVVGQLATNGQQIFFEFDSSWIKQGHELAPINMRRRAGLIAGDPNFDNLPPLFSGSLPDAYGRRIMRLWFEKVYGRTQALTPLEMLAYVGESGMGALTYHPVAATFPAIVRRALDIKFQEKLARALTDTGKADKTFVEKARLAAHSVGGMYPKFLCAEDTAGHLYEDDPRLERDFRRWIVKIPIPDAPAGNETEYLLNRLGRAAGIMLPEAKLIWTRSKSGPEAYFAVQRFDHVEGQRLHFSSLSVLAGRPASDLNIDYRDFFNTARELTRDASVLEEVFRRMVFNVAVCNTDDHAKNHAFIYQNGSWTLSPAFDVTFRPGTPGQEAIRAMPVLGSSSSISFSALLRAGEEAGIGRPRKIAMEVLDAVGDIGNTARRLSLKTRPLGAVIDLIEQQVTRLRPSTPLRPKREPRLSDRLKSFRALSPVPAPPSRRK